MYHEWKMKNYTSIKCNNKLKAEQKKRRSLYVYLVFLEIKLVRYLNPVPCLWRTSKASIIEACEIEYDTIFF